MLKAYVQGIWDSIKGTSLIFIVIKDTSSSSLQQRNQQPIEHNHGASENDRTNRSGATVSSTSKSGLRREKSKIDEYDAQQCYYFAMYRIDPFTSIY